MNHSVAWTEQNEPVGLSLDQLLYRMRRHDSQDGLLFDSVTLDEILQEEGVEQFAFDALVTPFSKLKRKMEILSRTMDRAIDGYGVTAMQVSDPFKRNGVAQVAAVFELQDGQTVSVYFHNPDNTPGKLAPNDEMISWKWLLNKKDITIVVAPERGNDLQIREVARRIMKLAQKNSAAFAKANAKRAERLEMIEGLRTEIADLEYELSGLHDQIEIAKVEAESRAMAPYKAVKAAGMAALNSFRKFLSRSQYRAMVEAIEGEEGAGMADRAKALAAIIEGMAATYDQDGKGDNATVYLHYFQNSADWFITEKDAQGGTQQAFGYADMGQGGELGYISIDELTKNGVELDLYFDPKPLKAVKPASAGTDEAEAGLAKAHAELDGRIDALSDDEAQRMAQALELKVGAGKDPRDVIKQQHPDDQRRGLDLISFSADNWDVSPEVVRALDEKAFNAVIEELTDYNHHGAVVVLQARRKGTAAQITEAEQIMQEQESAGHLTPQLAERRDALEAELMAAGEAATEQADPTTPEGYAAIMDDEAALTAVQDQLDSFFQARMIEVRNALRELGWEGERFKTLSKNGVAAVFDLIQVGAGANVAGMTVNGIRDDLTKTPAELAAEVDALAVDAEQESSETAVSGSEDDNSDLYAALYAEAVDMGLSPLSPDAYMQEINTGARQGMSLAEIENSLAEYRQMLLDLRAKKITPRRVVGRGAKQSDAVNWINGQIEKNEQAISTGGIGLYVNASNYAYYLRGLINEAPKADNSEPARPSFEVGDELEWRNDNGTLTGIYRGPLDETTAVIVVGGMQMNAPIAELYPIGDVADQDAAENAEGDLVPEGSTNLVKTAKGTQIETGFTLVEADSLIASHDSAGNPNPDYPQELQPRDRGRDASIAWVKKTANQLDPDSLGKTRRADTGAPIVGPDGVVESGNGRTMAIQEAYRSGKADEYREWLMEEAEFFGLSADKVRGMKAPVLVRVRTSAIDRREFAIEANQDDKLSMTATEKARADADRIDEALIARMSDDGDLLATGNRDFLAGFMQSLGDTEAAQYLTSDGAPTASLISRVQAAIFAKAYNDDRLLEMAADVSKPEVANVINALNAAAPEFIRAQAADQDGAGALASQLVDSVEVSLNEQAVQAIIDATNLVRIARSEGASVEEMVNQRGLFGDIPPATAAMALFINQNNRSSKRLGVAFRAMAEFLRVEAERGQTVDMFGDSQQASLEEIIAAANRELDKEYGEGEYAISSLDMFSPPAEPDPVTDEPEPVEPEAMTEPDQQAVEPEKQADTDYLQSIIDQTIADPLASDIADKLGEIFGRNAGDAEMETLIEQAAMAYQNAVMQATANL
jgi:hypothetical protein